MREVPHGLSAHTSHHWLGKACSNSEFRAKAQQALAGLQQEKREILQLQSQLAHRLKIFCQRPGGEILEIPAELAYQRQNIEVLLPAIDLAIADIESYLSRQG